MTLVTLSSEPGWEAVYEWLEATYGRKKVYLMSDLKPPKIQFTTEKPIQVQGITVLTAEWGKAHGLRQSGS